MCQYAFRRLLANQKVFASLKQAKVVVQAFLGQTQASNHLVW